MSSSAHPTDFDRQCQRRATLVRVWEDLLVRRGPPPAHGRFLASLSVGLPSAIDRLTRHMDRATESIHFLGVLRGALLVVAERHSGIPALER